ENDARGRAWAEARFKALGFDRVWTESVSFPVWDRGFESAAMTTPEATKLMVTALGGSIGTPEEGISGELMLFESAAALIEAEPGAAAGKIAFINQKMERARDGRAYGQAVIARVQGASAAAKAGAIAVLVRSIGTDTDSNSPHTGTMRYDNTPTRIPAAAVSHQDADRIEALLRDGQTVAISLQLGARVRQGEYQSANVIGQFDGREKPEEIVLLGAHLDSWDLGTGAIDDGAGIAITMAAGALIGQQAQPPRRSIRVVAYANEEQGIYGGKAYAEAHADDFHNHILALESDFGAGRIYRFDTRFAEAALPLATQMQTLLTPLGVERGSNEAYGGADISTLRAAEVPVAGLAQDGTLYFDIHHTANDTLDKIDAADLDQNVAGFVTVAWLAADSEAYLDERERPAGD
ncbi:MAG: M28 family peptidase, partial [Xanthomonadales bacterium]|nr:M28 family peptidase [Xanthomonadales bacterium]